MAVLDLSFVECELDLLNLLPEGDRATSIVRRHHSAQRGEFLSVERFSVPSPAPVARYNIWDNDTVMTPRTTVAAASH